MARRPNLLWICAEHQRWDTIAALGNAKIATPNLDRLVHQGCAFTHAFSQSPVCTPSRASFLTGRYPAATGCRQNGQDLSDDEVLFTQVLRLAGYDCGLAGKLHVCAAWSGTERRRDDGYRAFHWSHGSTAKHGGAWVEWLAEEGLAFDDVYQRGPALLSREVSSRAHHQTTWCFDRAADFVAESREAPWLLSVNPFAAHDPYDLLREFYDRIDPDSLPLPAYRPGEMSAKPRRQRLEVERKNYEQKTARQLREMVAAYYATIEHFDAELGRLLDCLEATGQRERTLILYHADHGDMMGDHGIMAKGPYLYDPALRVPLILSWPGELPAGQRSDALVELVDLVPTLAELLEVPLPDGVQGRSLVPQMVGEAAPEAHRAGVYAEHHNATPAIVAAHQAPSYLTMWRERGWKIVVDHGDDVGELYDLEADPGEHNNLWSDPAYAGKRAELLKRCFDARVFTMDPLPLRTGYF